MGRLPNMIILPLVVPGLVVPQNRKVLKIRYLPLKEQAVFQVAKQRRGKNLKINVAKLDFNYLFYISLISSSSKTICN